MSDAKNSPLPWATSKYDETIDANGEQVRMHGVMLSSKEIAKENMLFVRRAVNAHSDLLAALESVMQWGNDNGKMFRFAAESDSGVMQAIHAAIAKAK